MGKREFEEFISQSTATVDNKKSNEYILNRWYDNINELYSKIKFWLDDYIKTGRVTIEENEVEIFEEAIGSYRVPLLKISFAGNEVLVKPKGTIMIGTIGRVDLVGKSGNQRIILADKNATSPKIHFFEKENEKGEININADINSDFENNVEWIWKLASEPPKITFTELNQETFLDCLINITNG